MKSNRLLLIRSLAFKVNVLATFLTLTSIAWSQNNYNTVTGTLGTTYDWIDCSAGTNIVSGDDTQASVSWPFSFNFYQSTYTTANSLSVATNGFIRLDGVANGADYNAASAYDLTSTATAFGQIVVLAMYDGYVGRIPASSWLKYLVTGTAPNRILTVEYRSLEVSYNQNKFLNTQVSFYESLNKIVLKLGTDNITASGVDMGLHSGTAGYFHKWQEVLAGTNNTWIEYTPAIEVNASVGTTLAYYSTLKAAFDKINDGTHQGVINIHVQESTNETAAAVLNPSGTGAANYVGINMYPTTTGVTISGNLATPLIDLNGADNVIIDGRLNASGATKDLTISNTNTSNTAGTSTIRLINDATNNTIKYCNINGSETIATSGILFFSTANTGSGNDANTIDNNNITSSTSANRPINAIYSLGTVGKENSENVISNNNIYDFLKNGSASNGIFISSNSTAWTVDGNSFYETTSFISTGTVAYNAIQINNTTGTGFNILNNNIGGSAALCGGTAWTKTIATNNVFNAINLNVGTTTASSIQNNTIQNFSWSNSSAANWNAINVSGGNVNIGTTTGNTIGASTGTGSISVTGKTNGQNVYGINISSSGTVDCQKNTIGSITAANGATLSSNIFGIYKSPTVGITTISYNNIGSTSTENSFNASSASTANPQSVYGIYNAGTGTIIISSNTISKLTNGNTSPTSNGLTNGIALVAGNSTISNNTIYDLTNACGNPSSLYQAAVCGIALNGTLGVRNVTGNTIYNLSNIYASFTGSVIGIFSTGPTSGNTIQSNFVHSLSATGGSLYGIKIGSGSSTYSNNIINLGGTNPTANYGIYDVGGASQTCNLYFNTIHIGGSVSAGAINSYAIYSASNTNIRNYQNNICSNARANSGGTGKHYGIYYAVTAGTRTVDYNDYFTPNSGGIIGFYNGDQNTLLLLKTATARDVNSLNTDPLFSSAGGTAVANYYSAATLTGVAGTGITVGFYGITRNATPKMGALESNDYIWQGNTNTDFGTSTNWVNGVVPLDGSDISFAASPANDCLLDHNHTMRTITNAQSAKKFVVNGKQLTLTGDIIFSNGAQLDATAASSVVIFAGTAAQSIPSGAFVSNTIEALTVNNINGLTQNGAVIIPTALTLTSGAYAIGANSLTLNGSITTTSGTLVGGNSTNIVIGGSGANTTLPGVSLNNLTINRSNGISLGGNVSVAGTLALTAGTLAIGANTLTLNTNAPTITSGNIDASNASSTLILNNIGAVTLGSSFFLGSIKNLTLAGNTTLTASSNLTVNGVLNLATANPSTIKGSLDMGAYTLNMGSAATTTGQGDVTGTVTRTSFVLATPYTFGNQYTTMTFGGNGDLPTSMSFKITIGTAPAWKTNAIQRQYDVVRVGGTDATLVALQLHYLDGELNGNTESNMITWDLHVAQSNKVEEHGKAAQNITEEWISISNRKVTYFDVAADMHPWTLADKVSASFTWQGTPSTDWNDINNWSSGVVPISTSDVVIPDAATTLHDPLLPTTATAKTILIQQGGILDGGTGTTLTVSGSSGAWLNFGTLNAGTSTVVFTNANATMADPTNFYNVTIADGASLTPETGNFMGIAGTLSLTNTGILRAALLPNTIEFNGGNQTIVDTNAPIPGYYNLILSGSGTKTLSGTHMNVAGNLNIKGTTTVSVGTSVDVVGNMFIDAGTTIAAGAYTYHISGNITNNGTFTASPGNTIVLNGTSLQSVDGSSSLASFYNLTIDNSAGVVFNKDVNVYQTLALSNGNMKIGGYTLGINGAISQTSGYIETSTSSSLSFGGTTAITTASNLFYSSPIINNLTINRTGGVVSGSEIVVNGILNLQSANPSATVGALDMASYTLNMGENATTVGIGDVTGVVRRTTILPNIDYTFGNQFTYVYFSNEGTLPTELKLKIKIGTAPTWRTTAVKRVYDLIQTGASETRVLLTGHYLDSELNGNDENLLVDLQYIYPITTLLEKGRSNINTTDNWISLSNTNVGNLFSSFGNVELGFSAPSANVLTWNGSLSTSWINSSNWTPNNSPSASSILIIPDASTTPNDPIIPASSSISTLTILSGGIVNAVSDAQLTINGAAGAWSNSGGTFNASTSTVIFTNAEATMDGTTNFNNITIENGASLTNTTGSITRIAGAVTNNGIWHAVTIGATTAEYNGGNQTIVMPNMTSKRYFHLILSGTGTKTLPSTALNINGDLTLSGTVTATAAEALNISGNLNIGNGTTFVTGNFEHFIGGNFENNGTFTATSGKSVTFNGTTPQIISGSSTTNFDIVTIDNAAGVTLTTPENIFDDLALNNGNLIIGNTTLGINSTISKTSGYLSVSNVSSLSFGGTSALTLNDNLFTNSPTVNNLTINCSGGVSLSNQSITVDGTLALTVGTFTLAANSLTIAGNTPTRSSGNIDASNAASTLVFTNPSSITLPSSIFTGNVNNMTINGAGGITSSGDLSLNGILNLQSANPSPVKGSLDMSSYTLNMGATATTTGIGDVIGIVKREQTFNNGQEYDFGNQYTSVNFLNTGVKPTWLSCKISIGTSPTWRSEAIKRYYSFAQSGGTDRMIVKLHYLDAELHGSETDETKLVFWDAYDPAFAANNFVKVYPRNHNGTDATNNYIQLTGPAINYLATSATLDVKQWGLSYTNVSKHTWTGNGSPSYDGDWSLPGNWNGGVPTASDDVVIPLPSTLPSDNNGDLAPYRNLLSVTVPTEAKSIEIETGATLDASAYDLTINGDANAWVNNGTFIPGSKTVIFSNGDVAKTMTIAGTTNFNNLTIAEKTNIQPATNSIIRIGGTLDLNFNRSTIDFSSNVNTIEYNGAAQTVLNPNGTTPGYYHLILSGSGVKTLPGSTLEIIGNLNMSGNATATTLNNIHIGQNMNINDATNLTISTETSVEVTGSVTNNAGVSALRIKSSPTAANGSLIFHNSSNNPSATVEMYSKAAATTVVGSTYSYYKWQFMGIPIQSVVTNPTFSNYINGINNGSYINKQNEPGTAVLGNYWVSQGNTAVLVPFAGYEITQKFAKTITFQGQLVNSTFQETLTYTTGAKYPGQHLYGNSYTSAININNIIFGDDMEKTVYLYNTGSYADWTVQTGFFVNNAGQYIAAPYITAGTDSIPGQICSMQGFLVKAMRSSTNATIEIPYNSVAMKNTDKQRVRSVISEKLYTRIDVAGTRYSDKMWIFTDPSCTRGFDNGWDGYKFMGSSIAPQLWAIETAGDYQVDAVDDVNNTDLGFTRGEDTNYKLTFTHQNLSAQYAALYLIDLQTNSITDITQSGTQYNFTATASSPTKRFKIVTSPGISTDLNETANNRIKIYSSEKTIFINNTSDQTGDVYIYDIAGRMVEKIRYNPNSVTTVNTNLASGSYIAKSNIHDSEHSDCLIIK